MISRIIRLMTALIIPFMMCGETVAGLEAGNKSTSNTEATLEEFIEDFCKAEFTGNSGIRVDATRYGRREERLQKKRDPKYQGKLRFWQGDPLYVVKSYRVQDVRIYEDSTAVATVVYDRLARTQGDGVMDRKLIPDYLSQDIVTLHLISERSRWWIIDPPPPRISLAALIRSYRELLRSLGDDFPERVSTDEQKTYYFKLKADLNILEGLLREYGSNGTTMDK